MYRARRMYRDRRAHRARRLGGQEGHLLADRPLLALMERPGSGRALLMEGMLTEPLNTVRLS